MGKNGMLFRLHKRLWLAARLNPSAPPANLPPSLRTSTVRAGSGRNRARIRPLAPFKLYGFTSIRSLKNCKQG